MATFVSRSVNLTTAGTPQQITTVDSRVLSITFIAPDANTGTIYVGDSTVDKDAAAGPIGIPILPGRVMDVDPSKFTQATGIPHAVLLSTFWIDGTVTNEDLLYFALLDE